MNIEKLTQKSRQALMDAQQLAAEKHHQEVGGKHLMLALLEQEGGITERFLEAAGIDLPSFRDGLNQLIDKIPAVYGYEGSVIEPGGKRSPELER